MPIVMFKGNVTAKAIGTNNPASAFGMANFIAAGTAMQEALAASTANINLLVTSVKEDVL